MYKVFFNASFICLCSESENSFTGNNCQVSEIKDDNEFVRHVVKMEKAERVSNLIFINNDISGLWKKIRRQFIRITAAGGIVTDRLGRILVIKRFGFWDLPKGKVEKNESIEQAAVREVEEECGISGVQCKKNVGSGFHIYRSPYHLAPNNLVLKETHWFEMYYDGNEQPIPQQSEGIDEVRWMSRDELVVFFDHTYPNLKELLSRYLQESFSDSVKEN